jgi:hypothetical protein
MMIATIAPYCKGWTVCATTKRHFLTPLPSHDGVMITSRYLSNFLHSKSCGSRFYTPGEVDEAEVWVTKSGPQTEGIGTLDRQVVFFMVGG